MDADWSTLPMDLLFAIMMKLEYVEDFIYVSIVCRWWRYISSKIKHQWRSVPVPWLLFAENNNKNPNYLREALNFRNGTRYRLKLPETFGTRCWGTAYGWVVMIERDLNVRLFNPVTKAQIRFPSSKTIPHANPHFNEEDDEDIIWFLGVSFYKVIVVKVTRGDHHEFVIMTLNERGVCFARPENQSWTVLFTNERTNRMIDIVGVDDKVYGLFTLGQVVYWNVKELNEETVIKPIDFGGACPKVHKSLVKFLPNLVTKYLVEFHGDFLMILRHKDTSTIEEGGSRNHSYETKRFQVFRLDPKEKYWVRTKDLGGAALFIGGNSSIAISETLVKRGGVYFTDDEYQFLDLPRELGGHDMGVFFINTNEIRQFYLGMDVRSSFCPPTWFIPTIDSF